MKAVVLGICPDVTLVDISHDIPAHDVLTAALELSASYRYFPPATIFLVVVDPGVGSARRAIAAEAGDYRFVAPDNGVLTAVFDDLSPARTVELTEPRYAGPSISRTFEGRDRFAPAAAWIAKGVDLSALGRPAGDYHRLHIPVPDVASDSITGQVLRVDRFGNLITNISRKLFDGISGSSAIEIFAGAHLTRVVATYADAAPEEACALIGSSDYLEVAVNAGSASERLNLTRGAPVTITRKR